MMSFGAAVYLISNVVVMLAIARFMKVFFESHKASPIIIFFSYSLYLVATSAAFLFLNVPIVSLLINTVALFVIMLCYESKLPKKLLAVVCVYFYIFVVDIFILVAFGYFQFSPWEILGYDQTLGFVINATLMYLGSVLAQNFKNLRKNNPASPMFWVSAIVIPLSSIFVAVLIMSTSDLPQIWIVLAITVIFAINLLTFYLHDWLSEAYAHKLESLLNSQEKEFYYTQAKLMYESLENIKSFRHDIKNHLSVLRNYSTHSKFEKINEYLDSLLECVGETETFSETGNIAFDSIVNYKLKKLKDMGTNLAVKVNIPAELDIETSDVVAIMGNLLDNAIEGLEKVSNKKLSLEIVYSKGKMIISTTNAFDGNVKLDERQKVASINQDVGRGYGLKNILKAVEKYEGQMEVDYSDTEFSVKLLMYVKIAKVASGCV